MAKSEKELEEKTILSEEKPKNKRTKKKSVKKEKPVSKEVRVIVEPIAEAPKDKPCVMDVVEEDYKVKQLEDLAKFDSLNRVELMAEAIAETEKPPVKKEVSEAKEVAKTKELVEKKLAEVVDSIKIEKTIKNSKVNELAKEAISSLTPSVQVNEQSSKVDIPTCGCHQVKISNQSEVASLKLEIRLLQSKLREAKEKHLLETSELARGLRKLTRENLELTDNESWFIPSKIKKLFQ